MRTNNALRIVVAALASMAIAAQAAWPEKPVRLVVPFPPGGNVDAVGRIVSERLQQVLGQPFIVDNRPGAGGMIAGEFVARSAPDGYTFFLSANGPILFSPTIFKREAYGWRKDFIAVSSVSFTPLVLQVHPSTPFRSVAELIYAGRKPANTLTMASPGAGTQNHLVSEYLQRESGAHWTTVHYKGNAPAITDLLGGQVQFNFDQVSVAQPFIKEGKTRALAVTSPQRLPQLPHVPTLSESGFKDFSAETFTGVMAPRNTPHEIIERLSAALQAVLADKAVQQKFLALGSQARGSSPTQFSSLLEAEDKRWLPVIRQARITAE